MSCVMLHPVRFQDLPGWAQDDVAPAFEAFRRSAFQNARKPYRTGSLGLTPDDLEPAFAAAREERTADSRAFFERHFRPLRIQPAEGRGLVTAFYEPVADASLVRTERFQYPLYRRPDDLVDVDDANRPAGLDPYFAFARKAGDHLVEYLDRPAIEEGALSGRGLELVWLESAVDVFFIHVQGAARLRLTDGTERRVTYAAKSGHRFTGPGGILVAMGEIAPEAISMQAIRAWFAAYPERVDEILWQNRSFIFFRQAPVEDQTLGPIAAAKVPLTPGCSLAVDRLIHTFGTPIFIQAPDLTRFDGKPFGRLMVAQDTGSAITGLARGDLFAGSGDAAGAIAGGVRHSAEFTLLAPLSFAKRAAR